MITNLRELKPGDRCKVIKVNFKGELHKRIMEMGITAGAVIEVERVAPLGDPVEFVVKGYHLSLRKEEAANIDVEKI